jgi:peptide deformylase
MLEYLEMSQIDEYIEKYNLRAGWGLAYIQIGIPKRIFVLAQEIEEGKFEHYVVINPKIKSMSEEIVYIEEGEGCLSVNRPTEGIVPRHARMTIEAYDENGALYTIRVREELAVGFQHEMDHLDGILFTDRIDSKAPFKNKDKYRAL